MAAKSLAAIIAKTTEKYKLVYDQLAKNLARCKADLAYYKSLLKNATKADDLGAKTGIKAATAQIQEAQLGFNKYLGDCQKALSRNDINKFW